jgi:hypothetical protein
LNDMVSRGRRTCGVVLAALMCLNTACYSFVPRASAASPQSGARVRVRLTPAGMAGLAATLGPGVASAEGTLNEANADGSIVVGVTAISLVGGTSQFWNGANVVTFPPDYVAGVDTRMLDRSKTRVALIVGGLAMLGIFVVALGTSGAGGGGSAGPPPPTP